MSISNILWSTPYVINICQKVWGFKAINKLESPLLGSECVHQNVFLAGNTPGFDHHRYTDAKAKPCSVAMSGVHSVYKQGQEGQHDWHLTGVSGE